MYKNQDDLASPLYASQDDEREDIPVEERDIVADADAEDALPSHITVVPFSTTKTGSFQ
ncbi:hypothetical protein [Oxalicibacterium solurbis]|uniref:Uncharacterized protein n=1 Tax=Oxalicibacterium solurbis TaxID=69280 RepID=A0A8J3F3F0_9BURK|nr:hypothetical protein [Oxalicibacterium solurbis]GGI53462.1 hypothetical protein GCM10011430_06360 [Oxalicibacterium solurbis]